MNKVNNIREKSLVFIGFMGVGKTTVAQIVAKKLYRDFIDIDEVIEQEFGMPATDIFREHGEDTFRNKEKEYVFHYCRQPLKVISLGGGAFLQDEIREACLDHSIVFYLDISWESWKDRLHMLVDSRPVLQDKTLQDIEALFHDRKRTYKAHNSKLLTDSYNPEEVAEYIISSIRLAWELYE